MKKKANRQVARTLRSAARYIEKNGWTQHSFFARNGKSCCVLGAIDRATKNSESKYNAACDALRNFLDMGDLPGWNDTLERDEGKQIVIDTLLQAADAVDK